MMDPQHIYLPKAVKRWNMTDPLMRETWASKPDQSKPWKVKFYILLYLA